MRTPAQQAKARRNCFEAHKWSDEAGRIWLTCHICGGRIDPGREKWDADHAVRHAAGGSDDPSNVLPAHIKCHRTKTSADVTENAKGKRVSDKHFGIRAKQGWGGKYRKKLNGEVVER